MLPENEQAIQAVVPDLKGRFVKLIEPDKSQLIYFYAPWCQICELSISNLNFLSQVYSELDIKIVALDYQHPNEVEAFLSEQNLKFDSLLGGDKLKRQYQVFGYPSYYYVHKGIIVDKSYGYSTAAGLIIRQALISASVESND